MENEGVFSFAPQTRQGQLSRIAYGIALSWVYTLFIFLPVVLGNVDFVNRTEMPLRFNNTIPVFLYFTVVGVLLGWLNASIGRRIQAVVNISWDKSLLAIALMMGATTASTFIGQWAFNPAFSCMLEQCMSAFLTQYFIGTLIYGILMTVGTVSWRTWIYFVVLLGGPSILLGLLRFVVLRVPSGAC